MIYRDAELLRLARLAPRCFGCGRVNDGTVVAAHANGLGKGMSLKAPDFAWAGLDYACHMALDQGRDMSREDRQAFWLRAYWETQAWLWTSGLICVATDPVAQEPPTGRPIVRKARKSRPIAKGPPMKSKPFPKDGPKRPIPSRPFGK